MIVGLLAQRRNERAAELASEVGEKLAETGVDVRADPATASATEIDACQVEQMDECDLVVSIGGDGTFLFAARGAGSTPILGVNLGEVGFLNAVASENAVETVSRVVETYRDMGTIDHRKVPRVRIGGENWTLRPALNEVLVQGRRRGHANGIEVAVAVDGKRYDTVQGDGLLVATPTGSTAYNLSEGGPLVHPGVDAFVLTAMSGQEAMPPLLIPLEATVTLEVAGREAAVVSSDGTEHRQIELPATVTVERGAPARVAGPGGSFFEALEKLA
ncbi:MAG: NAD(+)/NADH kinase [Halodesulfurarchaeum sp.]